MATFPLARPARLAVLASGRGSNLEAIISAFPASHPLASVVVVISNKTDAGALEKAKAWGIEAHALPLPERGMFETQVELLLERYDIDLILLAGFMQLLSPDFVTRHQGRVLNIHPSLLPQFPGLEAPKQALEAGVKVSGCTVHFVDEGIDSGPVILQRRVPVLPKDTVETLSARILKEEHKAYPEAIKQVLLGKVSYPAEGVGG